MTADTLAWLQRWFRSQCDGEREHDKGVRIDTLDNPGWSVNADIATMSAREPIDVERNDDDWIKCEVREDHFYGCGGPENLQEILEVLRTWVETPAC